VSFGVCFFGAGRVVRPPARAEKTDGEEIGEPWLLAEGETAEGKIRVRRLCELARILRVSAPMADEAGGHLIFSPAEVIIY